MGKILITFQPSVSRINKWCHSSRYQDRYGSSTARMCMDTQSVWGWWSSNLDSKHQTQAGTRTCRIPHQRQKSRTSLIYSTSQHIHLSYKCRDQRGFYRTTEVGLIDLSWELKAKLEYSLSLTWTPSPSVEDTGRGWLKRWETLL